MKYEAIREYSQEFNVRKMCKVLNLAESAYYQWLRRLKKREEKMESERELVNYMRGIFEKNRKVYGYRRMYIAMEKERQNLLDSGKPVPAFLNEQISEYRVRNLMQRNGMFPVTTLKFKPYKNKKGDGRYVENIIKQDFKTTGLNEIWVGDITYIKTILGFVYLAVVLDLFNREIIGYSISRDANVELVKRALANALASTGGGGENTVFHSDRGTQYNSKSFQKMLDENNMTPSMSKAGCPYDNACVESFFSTAKRECIYRKEYATIDEVKQDLFEYIELFYNRKRMHGSLGHMSPVEYRLQKAV